MDEVLVRAIGGHQDSALCLGFIAEGGAATEVRYPDAVQRLGLAEFEMEQLVREAVADMARERAGIGPQGELVRRTACVVDDGGRMPDAMVAILRSVRLRRPRRVIVVVPDAKADLRARLAAEADAVLVYGDWAMVADPTPERSPARFLSSPLAHGHRVSPEAAASRRLPLSS